MVLRGPSGEGAVSAGVSRLLLRDGAVRVGLGGRTGDGGAREGVHLVALKPLT